VAEITPPDATILSDQDVLLSLYTQRSAYRTIVSPRLFYPPRNDMVRETLAKLPNSTLRPWNYAFVSRCDWSQGLDSDEQQKLRTQIDRRPDLVRVWQGDIGTLYTRKR
jgi:hypothetical protein